MNLRDYAQKHTQIAIANLVGESPSFVNQWVNGKRPVPAKACVAIEQATNGQVTRQEIRPDDWHLIWPELVHVTPQIQHPSAQAAGQGA